MTVSRSAVVQINSYRHVVRFGSRSARIFRLLLRKRHLEQKQVEDFAMIPAKEAKDMLYMLLSQNLVQLQVRNHDPAQCPDLYSATLRKNETRGRSHSCI